MQNTRNGCGLFLKALTPKTRIHQDFYSSSKPTIAKPKTLTPISSSGTPRAPSPTNNDPLIRFYNHSKQSIKPPRILITGGMGQLGRSLADIIKYMYGRESVLLTDINKPPSDFCDFELKFLGGFRYLNILNKDSIHEIIVNNRIDTIVHFSALLSAVGEQNVELALQVNCEGVQNILNAANTIGAFGVTTPRAYTPDLTIQRPTTIYGVTKVFAELLGEYYFTRYGVDFRSLRFPGIISNVQPGGGTTAPSEALSLRTYNVTGFSFTPEEITAEIQRHIPNFRIFYDVCPIRQGIADSWPESLDDSKARQDWNWKPEYNLSSTVNIMLQNISVKIKQAEPPKSLDKIEMVSQM